MRATRRNLLTWWSIPAESTPTWTWPPVRPVTRTPCACSVDGMTMDYAGWVSSKLAMRASASRKDASRERPSRFV